MGGSAARDDMRSKPPPESVPPVRTCPTCGGEFPIDFSVCPKDATPLTDDAQADPLIDVVIGAAYRIKKVITAGGMGRLYEAEHVRLERPMAVKVLHESHAHRREAVERFNREAKAISRIRSDHVLRIVDLLPAPDARPCIITDLLVGEDLQHRLERENSLEIGAAVGLTRQLCAGVAAAHAMGVVHRDLKPSNIFLAKEDSGEETLKILDFGVAKLVDAGEQLTQTGALVGTPAYMAPEQAAGDANVDTRADVYAVGAVLYHMLTGQPPYGHQDATGTLMRLLKGDPSRARTINSQIPEGLEEVLERAMARAPADRYPTIEDLEDAVAPFGALRDPTGRITLERRAERMGRRSRWRRPLAILLALLTSLVTAGWLAAFLASVLFEVTGAEEATELMHASLIALPSVVGAVVAGLCARALYDRWRSGPKIDRLAHILGSSVLTGLLTFAVAELGVAGWRAFIAEVEPPNRLEHTVALGLAMLLALGRFLWERRNP